MGARPRRGCPPKRGRARPTEAGATQGAAEGERAWEGVRPCAPTPVGAGGNNRGRGATEPDTGYGVLRGRGGRGQLPGVSFQSYNMHSRSQYSEGKQIKSKHQTKHYNNTAPPPERGRPRRIQTPTKPTPKQHTRKKHRTHIHTPCNRQTKRRPAPTDTDTTPPK